KEASSRFLESDGAFLRVLEGLGVDESKSPRRPPVIAAPPVLRVLFGKPRDPRKAPAFRALGELGLKAQPGKSVNIVRQLMQGLEEEEKKNSNPLDAGDSRILTGLRLVDSIQEEALGALVKIALKAEETLPLYA